MSKFQIDPDGYKNYGDLSAVEPWHRVSLQCHNCKTRWYGCWDNFECPECGKGDIPMHLSWRELAELVAEMDGSKQ